MSEKNYDRKGRWRNKTIAFRMSPEETNELNIRVKLSGLTKQDYLVNKALEKEIVVQGNPKVYIALKHQLEEAIVELERLQGEVPSEELLNTICLINRTLYGMKSENDCP